MIRFVSFKKFPLEIVNKIKKTKKNVPLLLLGIQFLHDNII
jgi:hypothetical protein